MPGSRAEALSSLAQRVAECGLPLCRMTQRPQKLHSLYEGRKRNCIALGTFRGEAAEYETRGACQAMGSCRPSGWDGGPGGPTRPARHRQRRGPPSGCACATSPRPTAPCLPVAGMGASTLVASSDRRTGAPMPSSEESSFRAFVVLCTVCAREVSSAYT